MGFSGGGGGGASTPAFAFGTAAAQPPAAAGNANTGYFATDTGEVTFSDGAAWHSISTTSAMQFLISGGIGMIRVGNYLRFKDPNGIILGDTGTVNFTSLGFQLQGAAALWSGGGAPVALGTNGDIYINTAGGAGTTVYQQRGGAWVGII